MIRDSIVKRFVVVLRVSGTTRFLRFRTMGPVRDEKGCKRYGTFPATYLAQHAESIFLYGSCMRRETSYDTLQCSLISDNMQICAGQLLHGMRRSLSNIRELDIQAHPPLADTRLPPTRNSIGPVLPAVLCCKAPGQSPSPRGGGDPKPCAPED